MKTTLKMETLKTLQEALAEETCRVGYVYPDGEESYWIRSNLSTVECVECTDGFYYREIVD